MYVQKQFEEAYLPCNTFACSTYFGRKNNFRPIPLTSAEPLVDAFVSSPLCLRTGRHRVPWCKIRVRKEGELKTVREDKKEKKEDTVNVDQYPMQSIMKGLQSYISAVSIKLPPHSSK